MSIGEHDRRIRDMLPAVVGQVPVGVGVVRMDRSIAYRNDELARILRLDAKSRAVECRLPRFVRRDGTACGSEDDPLTRLLDTGLPTQRSAATLERHDGSRAEVAVTLTPIIDTDGPVVGAVLYAEDMTEDADEASLHEAFVGVLSHELRTPITSIYGGAQLLLNDRMPTDVRETVVTDIAAEAEQLFRLVEDLLAITRLERGVTEADGDPVLLQRLARQAARAEERRWPGRRVQVTAETDLPAVRADDGLTMQVLRNLISDAVKYSPAEESVDVLLTSDEIGVRVMVLDRGPGFPPETGADAFQLFHRSPGVTGRVAGTGIGLYVARALVEAQGGRIWLHDRPGGGAEVGFAPAPVRAVILPNCHADARSAWVSGTGGWHGTGGTVRLEHPMGTTLVTGRRPSFDTDDPGPLPGSSVSFTIPSDPDTWRQSDGCNKPDRLPERNQANDGLD